jgi:hypothetical protein
MPRPKSKPRKAGKPKQPPEAPRAPQEPPKPPEPDPAPQPDAEQLAGGLFGPAGGADLVDWLDSMGGIPAPEPPKRVGRPPNEEYKPIDMQVLAAVFKGCFAFVGLFAEDWTLADREALALARIWKPILDYYQLKPSIVISWVIALGGTVAVLQSRLAPMLQPLTKLVAARIGGRLKRKAGEYETSVSDAGPVPGTAA